MPTGVTIQLPSKIEALACLGAEPIAAMLTARAKAIAKVRNLFIELKSSRSHLNNMYYSKKVLICQYSFVRIQL
jgi:hypothetical protein